MKRFYFLVVLAALNLVASAQMNMYVWQNGVKVTYPVLGVDSITFGEEPEPEPFVSLINVEDGSVADWKKVPANYLASATCAAKATENGLKSVKVYADKEYINVLVEYNTSVITNTELVPFHMYINADNSASTGGYKDNWPDADTEILLEGFVFSGGAAISYAPSIFEWIGGVGQSGWSWNQLASTEEVVAKSQTIGNKIEFQVNRKAIPANWHDTDFTIGFDIQQDWNTVGYLPNNGEKTVNKLAVTIDWEGVVADPEEPVVEKTQTYVESEEIFANPERGFLKQIYYTSQNLNQVQNARTVKKNREDENVTLYLDNYFMMDYINSDISQSFLTRMENNFKALRDGGGKAVIRYSYKYDESISSKPWDATKQQVSRHIEQLEPYWHEYQDVILCLEAGFIGVWGEWYYTDNFSNMKDRWDIVTQLLEALPEDLQLALRTPGYKMKYLKHIGESVDPLTAAEAYQNTEKARLCGHNDCFVASNNDVGTYANDEEREFWAADTKYTLMGGETCGECEYSDGANAIKEMAKYHWTYINDGYHQDVLNSWVEDGSMNEIKRRLGYRFVLREGTYTLQDNVYTAALSIENVGFAALAIPRDVELVFVNKEDANDKYVYKQDVDPRFWMAGESTTVELEANLDADMMGEYDVYLNLPDSHANLHDNPAFSIRLANEDMWDEERGYNYLTDIEL